MTRRGTVLSAALSMAAIGLVGWGASHLRADEPPQAREIRNDWNYNLLHVTDVQFSGHWSYEAKEWGAVLWPIEPGPNTVEVSFKNGGIRVNRHELKSEGLVVVEKNAEIIVAPTGNVHFTDELLPEKAN